MLLLVCLFVCLFVVVERIKRKFSIRISPKENAKTTAHE